MNIRFETYSSCPAAESDKRFVFIAYGEGKGRFKIRRTFNEQGKINYLISSYHGLQETEEILSSISSNLEKLFSEGALSVEYIEGDILIEFLPEQEAQYNSEKGLVYVKLATEGLVPFLKKYALPLYEFEPSADRSLLLCVLIVCGISLVSYFYGASILPLEWPAVTAYSLIFVVLSGFVFINFTRSLIRAGKLLTICFFCAASILCMLLIGVLSKEFYFGSQSVQEGIIETTFKGTRSNFMRIRIVSKPNLSFLVSKSFLKQEPKIFPQAIKLRLEEGLFRTQYIRDVSLIE